MIFTYKPVSKRRFTRIEDIPEGVPLRIIDWRPSAYSTVKLLEGNWDAPVEYTKYNTALNFQLLGKYAIVASDTFILELW